MFCWPIYYGQSALSYGLTKTVDDALQGIAKSIVFAEKFLGQNDFFLLFQRCTKTDEAFKIATSKIPEFTDVSKLSKMFTKAEAAKGNYLYNEFYEPKFVLTDLKWFAKMIDIISNSTTTSNEFSILADILGIFLTLLIKVKRSSYIFILIK